MLPWPLAETYTKLGREMLHTLISELGCGHSRGLQLDGQESLPGSDHQGSPAKGKRKSKLDGGHVRQYGQIIICQST